MHIWTCNFDKMAEAPTEENCCVLKEIFHHKLHDLKAKQTKNESLITLFIDDHFFEKAKRYLKHQAEKSLGLDSAQETCLQMTKWEINTIKRKNWSFENDSLVTEDKKKVVPKGQLHEVLSLAHRRINHRGRQITSKWINNNYSEVNSKVISLFVASCRFHAEQQSITSRVKMVEKPLQSPRFLSLLEIDLMDFRNCPCDCREPHTWAINIIDHHTKYVYVSPLINKTADEVLRVIKMYCYTYGFPKMILTDNGKEFKNKKMETFCNENGIKQGHGSPRTPTTQGLVERANRSWKEDMRALIVSTNKETNKWCQSTMEAAYVRNIAYHRAIKQSPYEAVYGIKPHREQLTPSLSLDQATEGEAPVTTSDTDESTQSISDERTKKRKSISENQEDYNNRMIKQTRQSSRSKSFKVDDMVSIKIDKVDKKTPMHPNMLMGKITATENGYAKVVTQFGVIQGYIATSRLQPCTATGVKLNYDKEISFSSACKEAHNSN